MINRNHVSCNFESKKLFQLLTGTVILRGVVGITDSSDHRRAEDLKRASSGLAVTHDVLHDAQIYPSR